MMDGHGTPAAPVPRGVLLALDDDAGILRAINAPGSGMTVVRRCADTTELLSAALAGLGGLAVVGTDFDELDRTVIDRLSRAGVTGLLLAPDADRERWSGVGWPVESYATPPAEVCARLQAIGRGRTTPPEAPAPAAPLASGQVSQEEVDLWEEFEAAAAPHTPSYSPLPDQAAVNAETASARGALVVVWGPQGAPGRSTLAAALAAGLADETILVDADVEAPSLTQLLGLPEDSSALATAARLASRGRLDAEVLDRILVPVSDGCRLLTGLGRPGRWRELPPAAMPEVWERCRFSAPWTVVDVAGGQVDDAIDDFTLEPGRGAVTAELLRSADVVVIVGAGDPIGVRRLLQLIDDLDDDIRPSGRVEVVVNRVRAAAAGPAPQRAVRQALARFGGVEEVTVLPDDAQTADRCLMEGRSVLEAAPASPLGKAMAELVDRIDPHSGAVARAGLASRGALIRAIAALMRSRRTRPPAKTETAADDGGAANTRHHGTARVTGSADGGDMRAAAIGAPTPAPPPPPQAHPAVVSERGTTALEAAPTALTSGGGERTDQDSPRRRRNGRHRA
ncbi:AAA family ATPase [Actinomyces qiguomingii]|uniref:AAA family ATPase n=1 Tax=Actinomyces qiguomingii TaxID=2057800 RepID=UPI001E62E43E|nr:hypothetical protein [Actinomyces qiguomingii]